ncbi:hypothetical protein OAJ52_07390 [Bacteroidia bacterium]|jgi:hypothetical protein|nr:hypothetical protein [Bacteroidia bacterium]|tara:strand:+ start:8243 stop:8800 length:558 start_codon:yes stop_codon:yes gene_type:complete
MKRIGLIATLFFIAFFFTQCSDDCGSDVADSPRPIGVKSLRTEFVTLYSQEPNSHIDSFRIAVYSEFDYARLHHFSFINAAYACTPAYYSPPTLGEFIDSIKVYATSDYRGSNEVTSQIYFDGENSLSEFNAGIARQMETNYRTSSLWSLKNKPTSSDTFSFSFYYYSNGSIADSSKTQEYFIRE